MLKRLFKKIKTDVYLVKRLFESGEGKYFFSYCKNRYFGSFLAARFPKYEGGHIDEDFEVHVLCQRAMLWPLVVCLRSFLHHSGLCPRIIVHIDDFDEGSIALLENKFSNVRVFRWDEATKAIDKIPDISDKIKKIRFGPNILATKLTDDYLLSKSKYVMVIGSDVLFYSKPSEIIDFVGGRSGYDAIGSYDLHDMPILIDEEFKKRLKINEQGLNHLNSDLIIFDKTKMLHHWFTEYFDHILDPENYFVDSAGFSVLYARLKWKFLEHDRYRIKGDVDHATVAKHFTGPRRWQLYSWGIDLARKNMSL
ncbi:MAG: hypothetical protein A3I39_03005 [Candidatus Yanofskybacteria bacterium RIFCSPLOWO2_02_FULL_47_9b]|uniref:Glycosyl transferase n=1 Tax=Candidatus Yanofskybacteria bacterium RIFCSPLOWO2_02_FULL_47_9b TaxID=1802708 RepID=A0A1F8H6G4_9BACT|nr:MAG: hypothetical protein A3I39_03005 [Candidatus Yanofskybacteria bacterium RIFCSPLOWO2_02_FULL_47_9b]